MFGFLKKGKEYNNLANQFNATSIMTEEVIKKIKAADDPSDYEKDVFMLAYISRKGILDRLEEYDWSLTLKIIVPSLGGMVTIIYALNQTIEKIKMLATKLDIADEINEILAKGEAFYTLEKLLPENVKTLIK